MFTKCLQNISPHCNFLGLVLYKMVVSILIACYIFCNIKYISCHKEYLHKIDVVDFEILEHRDKRATLLNTDVNKFKNQVDVEIRFSCVWKNFHLVLSEDVSFKEILVESYIDDHFSGNLDRQSKFYEGHLEDNSLDSTVFGFILNGSFTGKITDATSTYFIEPATTFFGRENSKSKIVVYRDVDIRPAQWKIFSNLSDNLPELTTLYRLPQIASNITIENLGLDITNETRNLFCEIELVSDHTLYNYLGNDTDRTSAFLLFHAKFADYMFRKTDFSMNGRPDGIRIALGKIFIYTSDKDDNYPMVHASSVTEYLSLLPFRRQGSRFCLSIALSHRRFKFSAIGASYKAKTDINGIIGGICDKPILDVGGFFPLSFNTGVVNVQFPDGAPLPIAISVLALVHEIAHGFGSDHDPVKRSVCSPGEQENYLMYPTLAIGSKNVMKFSPCSRTDIWKTLILKGGCLKHKNPVCGNGIRENDEECDCGSELSCDFFDPCCTPSDVSPPEKGCTIRSKNGYTCSFREHKCCDRNCSVTKIKDTPCYSDEFLCLYSFCDGKSVVCPKAQKVPERCDPHFMCDNTTCSNSTICLSQGLKDCLCKGNLTTECLQCCQKDNDCIPASELGIQTPDGKPYTLRSGSKCYDERYVCNNLGECIVGKHNIRSSSTLSTSVIVISLLFSALVLFTIYFSWRDTHKTTSTLRNGI